jgi:NAD(P)-dependent dehydrogenase (short-subunit alcohol dehydrogenase family)
MSIDEPSPSSNSISSLELSTCIKVLSKFATNDGYPSIESDEFDRIRPLIHNLYHIGKRLQRKNIRNTRRQIRLTDQKAKNSCLLRSGRAKKLQQLQLEHILVPDGVVETASTTETSIPQRLVQSKPCYICKLKYRTLHFFYDRLCPSCAKLNYDKRLQTTDLTNSIGLVTGGRVKIGYRIVLKLLRANCFVITTSRFPMDLLNRLNKEEDFSQWKDRVHIYGVDFRYSKLVELFTQMLIEKYEKLDFIINNACQTIQRPNDYYQHLINHERLTNYSLLPNDQLNILNGNLQFYQQLRPVLNQLQHSSYPLSLPSINDTIEQSTSVISKTSFDVNHQPIDLRSTNSWLLRLDELSTTEINEVLTINTLVPFILNSKLKVLMADKHPNPDSIKFIINVSAMEGSFSRVNKTDRHPHTNAAKAALNMMTRTSAIDYKQSNIYMVSVDTGWINDENPLEKAMKLMINRDFQTPLDEEDAAARVLDPIIDTYRQIAEGKTDLNIPYGCFLKDYSVCNW